MNKNIKHREHWTYENCKEIASLYNYKKDFKREYSGAYDKALDNGWLDDICKHMILIQKKSGYWSYEKCKEYALLYDNIGDFIKECSVAYSKASKEKWLSDICKHMSTKKHRWSFEECEKEALKYNNKKEFRDKNHGCYLHSSKNKYIDIICSHMKGIGNRKKKIIYSYEFSDKSVYVGLTYDYKERYNRHINDEKSIVYIYKNKIKEEPKYILLSDYIDVEQAQILEGKKVEEYRNNGWFILNRIKTGGIGGNIIKWSYDKCKEEVLKYSTKTEFRKNNASAYSTCLKNKWIKELCTHMIKVPKNINRRKWTFDKCYELFLVCDKDLKKLNKNCIKAIKRYKYQFF